MNKQTQFFNAVSNSNLHEAERLIEHIDVNENLGVYLITAANRTDQNMLELLLQHGADPQVRSGMALEAAALKSSAECLTLLLPYFSHQKWDALLDRAFETVAQHHKTFQSSAAVKATAPYASEAVRNKMMAHAILSHRSLIVPVLLPLTNPQKVFDLLTSSYSSRLTHHHDAMLEMLNDEQAKQQKQRIEDQLPDSQRSNKKKI